MKFGNTFTNFIYNMFENTGEKFYTLKRLTRIDQYMNIYVAYGCSF